MKDASQVAWARRILDDQLERISELRNANPRDPGFKLWRQTTLTIIQRIWPGDLARCERFRRIPFSGTSPRPTRAQIRENYERGCAEASAYLKILTLELETKGMAKAGAVAANPKPAMLPDDLAGATPPAPADPRDMFEPSPFDRIQPAAQGQSPPAAAAASPAPTAPDSSQAPASASTPPAAKAPSPPPPPAAKAPSASPPPRPAPSPPAPASPQRPARRLKEMLGFGDDGARAGASGESPPAPPPAFGADSRQEDVLDPRLEAMLSEAEERAFGLGVPPSARPETEPEAPEYDEESEDEQSVTEDPPPARDAGASGDMAIDFLSRSRSAPASATPPSASTKPAAPAITPPPTPPVARPAPPVARPAPPVARPVAPPAAPAVQAPVARAPDPGVVPRPAPVAPPAPAPPVAPASPAPIQPQAQAPLAPVIGTSPTSAALVAIAGQVDRLGVPEGQTAAARAALIDLAKQLDEGIASFDSIREILWIVADYPPLARRTIPLLIPHLDLE